MKSKELLKSGFEKSKQAVKDLKTRKFSKKFYIILSIVVLLIIALMFFAFGKDDGEEEKKVYTEGVAMVGDLTETIEQSGVVEPYERREIISLARGEIIESPFEEGDKVEKDDLLYKIDDEDAQLNIEKAQLNLDDINENISNLYIYASASGTISDFKLKEGENAPNGVIGYITDNDTLTADIPFSSFDFDKISVGDRVTLTSALYMSSFDGVVTHKYDGLSTESNDGSMVKNIEVTMNNPGSFATGTTVSGVVNTNSGDVYSTGSGTVESGGKVSILCEVSGSKVDRAYVKNGDRVKKGQLIAVLKNNSLYTNKKSSELNLKSSKKTLENYNITAPISGTVITKNSKQGDKIDNSNSNSTLMVIADMSKMKFTISVDELDIAKIKIDQRAVIDADAIENETFEGRVTKIASEGISSGNGVTTYEVEIVIDEPGSLKSGMNVNANIVINEAKDAVYVPEEAVMMANQGRGFVLVKSDGKKKSGEEENKKEQMPNGEKPQGQMPNGERPQGQMPNGGNIKGGQNTKGNMQGGMPQMGMDIPEGYELVRVETGISDGTYTEIKSGISEGDEIIYIKQTASEGGFMMFPGMGRMPSGGMGGGMSRPSGGMSRPSGGMSGGGTRQMGR